MYPAVKKSCSGHLKLNVHGFTVVMAPFPKLFARAPCLSPASRRRLPPPGAAMRRNARGSTWNPAASSLFCRPDPNGADGTFFEDIPKLFFGFARARTHLYCSSSYYTNVRDHHAIYVFSRAVRRRCSPSCWRGSHGSLGTQVEGSEVRAGPRVNV